MVGGSGGGASVGVEVGEVFHLLIELCLSDIGVSTAIGLALAITWIRHHGA